MILVTGATGKVGRQAVSELLARGAEVRALVRDPSRADLPDGAEIVAGDLTDADSVRKAAAGVDGVFLIWPLGTTEHAPEFLDAVGQARRILYLSSAGVGESSDPITNFHAGIERLIEASGLEWTILRPVGFAGNTMGWADGVRTESVVRAPYGKMARPLIHERDMAAVGALVLTEDGHVGRRYVLSGPELVTQIEQAQAIGEAIGRPVRFEEQAPEIVREQMIAQGWPAETVDGMLTAWSSMTTDHEPITGTVRELLGRPALSYRQWAADHAADFR